MREFGSLLAAVFSDRVIFIVFEVIYLAFFLYAVEQKKKRIIRFLRKIVVSKKGIGAIGSVKRGNESWNWLYLAFGIASLVIVELIAISEFGKGYKVIIVIANLVILIYLAFFNAWFRNKAIGIISKSKNMEERY